MQQQINLYKIERKKQTFSFNHLLLSVAAVVGLIAVLSIKNSIQHYRSTQELARIEKERGEINKKLEDVAAKVPPQQTRVQITDDIKKYQALKTEKQTMIGLLVTAKQNKIPGFSSFLEALSRQTLEGVWLTEFGFKDKGAYFSLEGNSLKPDLIPEFMTNLSKEAVFQGMTFEIFKLNLNEESKELHFVLQTEERKKQS